MCSICEKQVIENGIRESDLLLLPFVFVKWRCLVPGCKGGCRVKDYGNDPFYFDPAKRREDKDGYRGGWSDLSQHFYLCGRHWKDRERILKMMSHRLTPEYYLSMIKSIKTK